MIRHSPLSSSILDVLADVELQVCVQWLGNRERLLVARVYRRTLSAMSAPFAWRTAEPFALSSMQPDLVARASRSLIRFAPLYLRWESPLSCGQLAALPPLRGIHGDERNSSSEEQWQQLLHSPAMRQLAEVHAAERPLSAPSVALLSRLASLHTLAFRCPLDAEDGFLRPLLDLPHLTSLACVGHAYILPGPWLSVLCEFSRLRRLSLSGVAFPEEPDLAEERPRAVFRRMVGLAQLQELELSNFIAVRTNSLSLAPSAAEWRELFSGLPQLRVLRIGQLVHGQDSLLPPVAAAASSLRSLVIHGRPHPYPRLLELNPLPSAAVLRTLLAALPPLHVQLRFQSSTWEAWRAAFRHRLDVDWNVLRQQWEELQSLAVTPRVQLVLGA